MENSSLMILLKKSFLCFVGLCLAAGLSAQSKSARKLVEKAREDMQEGTLVAATVKLTQAIAKYENYAEAYELRGMSFQNMGRLEQANKDYIKAVEIDPTRIISLVRLIGSFKEAQQWEKVKKYAKIIQINHPDNNCPATFELAHAHDKLSEKTDALSLYLSFLEMTCEGMNEQRKLAQERVDALE